MKAAFNVILAIIMVATLVTSASAATATSRMFAQAQAQTLPTCTDPTGNNLPCMMVISTLPAPTNTVQCQETTGQILPCSYATQILSNGQEIVVITVYVPLNFVFVGGPITIIKVIHEESAKSSGGTSSYDLSITIEVSADPIIRGHIEAVTVTVSDKSNPSKKIVGAKVGGEVFYHSGFHKSISCSNTDQNGKSECSFIIGPNSDPGTFKITINVSASGYKPASKSATFTVIAKPNATSVVNSTVPVNGTNTTSTNTSNMSSLLFKPPSSNTSAVIQPSNKSIPTSGGGKSKGNTCSASNCTSGTAPPSVDCSKNPSDPSCTQTLAPTPVFPTVQPCHDSSGKCTTQPTLNPINPPGLTGKTKVCPDGSIIPKKDKCPTATTPASGVTGSSESNNPQQPTGQSPPPTGSANEAQSSGNNGGSSSSSSSNGDNSGGSGSKHHHHS